MRKLSTEGMQKLTWYEYVLHTGLSHVNDGLRSFTVRNIQGNDDVSFPGRTRSVYIHSFQKSNQAIPRSSDDQGIVDLSSRKHAGLYLVEEDVL